MSLRTAYFVIGAVLCAPAAHAGQASGLSAVPDPPVAPAEVQVLFDGPPPPVAPEAISRDASGKATLRAIRLTEPLRVDGRLDEAVYEREHPMSDFVQTEPQEGSPATERTEIWVMFDEENLYVTFRCFETQPERRIANVMQKDNGNLFQNDGVSFFLDTFYDRRNGVGFMIGPIGGRTDGQITDERWKPRLEHDLGLEDRGFRRGMGGRGRHSVQVAQVPARPGAGLGIQRASHRSVEERDFVSRPDAAAVGDERYLARLGGADDVGGGSATRRQEH